ncbi:MAG: tRNA preQ1(34) S-adenosylmethionine ribosyltransferase-isomerase QueA [Terriglobales bacterium]
MRVSDFDYVLPPELIAQQPLAGRADSRLLHLNPVSGAVQDRCFRDFPQILRQGDLVVFNNTRVFPARLFGRKNDAQANHHHANPVTAPLPGKIEVLLTRQLSADPNEWECLVRPGRKVNVADSLTFGDGGELRAEVIGRGQFGERRLRFHSVNDFFGLVERLGHIPLPPYIDRQDRAADRERYQTVYARERGSVAAPTAGLHFTPEILEQMKDRGIDTTEITLHVGLGTFQPIRVDRVEEHSLHREAYRISQEAAEKINAARSEQRRIIAIGTTTVRMLEYCASRSSNAEVQAGSGEADIFIYPGYEFRAVNGLLTNFHLPKSTLLMLISAFAGREQVLAAYAHAIEQKYRFYSYGDCMFIE